MPDSPGKRKYDAKNARMFGLKLYRTCDAAMIDWLSQQPNVNGYLKDLIRADMERKKSGA